MYLAQTSNTIEIQAPFYVDLIENIISNGNEHEKNSIDSAIKQAKKVASDEMDVFAIDNKYYYFITTLLEKYNKELLTLDVDHINSKTYKDILNILK
ncbi:hypothetical protein V5739_07185 [Salinimicrobium sp. TIG7-5_MAKvit]|uniref:hypothetical protein n=1 Tax=Salinimicrobium sp. TIG7-5_MAKvit TaxID=3121289 RepID=UPI003C6E469E